MITIGKIQELATLKDLNPIEQMAHEVSICLDIPYSDVEIWSLDKLKSEYGKLKLDKLPDKRIGYKFKHEGRRFRLVKNAKEMSAHHFIELQEVVKGDMVESLHQVIALLSYRVDILGRKIEDDYQWKVDNFKDLEAEQFYGYALFFSLVYPKLLIATQTYLKEEEEKLREMYSDGLAS
jgi:hypothetical protein